MNLKSAQPMAKPISPPTMAFPGTPEALSFYDSAPLAETLDKLVDWDLLNAGPVRLSVGAVDVESGNFRYFDTTTGPKREAASYTAIAEAIGLDPADILFLSDTLQEIAAARAAGMQALLIDRDGGTGDIATFGDIAA